MFGTKIKNQESQLDEMRKARETSNVAFIRFSDNHTKFLSHVFCFYEGEDGKYYNRRIKDILGKDIIPIITGDKNETLKTWRKIKSDPIYNIVKKMFFIDRDMDDVSDAEDTDLYITPCYSIENLYVNSQTLSDILQSEFSCSKIEIDHNKCVNKFKELYEQFNNEMIEFNALVLLRQKKNLGNGKVRLNDVKTHQMIEIRIDGISKGNKYEQVINKLKSELDVREEELNIAINEIKNKGDYGNLFRGKNQMDFMVVFINTLKQLHGEEKFFSKKYKCVTINITKNRLSELSQYADSPKCLQKFIKTHRVTTGQWGTEADGDTRMISNCVI